RSKRDWSSDVCSSDLRREEKKSGKTHLAIGLGMKAIHRGYKAIFTTMGELVQTLKTEEITRKSQTRMKRIRNADLVIIDDLMFMAMNQQEANSFFHLINDLYNATSIILTSNKASDAWCEVLWRSSNNNSCTTHKHAPS